MHIGLQRWRRAKKGVRRLQAVVKGRRARRTYRHIRVAVTRLRLVVARWRFKYVTVHVHVKDGEGGVRVC